jgi:sulfoxide reductase heme-binding subunit YedZ
MVSWSALSAMAAWVVDDIYKRPFITIGFASLVAMLPLALTSTTGMIRRLGGRRWQRLHRLVYLAAILGVMHYWMLVKSDIRLPAYYGLVVASLLAFRVYWARMQDRREGTRVAGLGTSATLTKKSA